uniref:Uncharacterized protein n=1 Tax=Denticeps clupeoides TaxID=299321 RepID=A0AAY4BWV9_9TELE
MSVLNPCQSSCFLDSIMMSVVNPRQSSCFLDSSSLLCLCQVHHLLQLTVDGRLHDSVPDVPVYARVQKGQPRVRPHDVQYADIYPLKSPQTDSRGRPSETEYASIEFRRDPGRPPEQSTEPADLLIPPGALHTPMPRAQRKKGDVLQGAVLV